MMYSAKKVFPAFPLKPSFSNLNRLGDTPLLTPFTRAMRTISKQYNGKLGEKRSF